MLVIEDAAAEALSRERANHFRDRLLARLRSVLPPDRIKDAEVARNVERGIAQASECHIVREIDVTRFIETICVCFGGFPDRSLPSEALAILRADDSSAEQKLDRFAAWCEKRRR